MVKKKNGQWTGKEDRIIIHALETMSVCANSGCDLSNMNIATLLGTAKYKNGSHSY